MPAVSRACCCAPPQLCSCCICLPKQVGGRQDTPAYLLRQLQPGHTVAGPAMLIDDISTVVVEPRCTAHITAGGNIRISVSDETAGAQQSLEKADPIQLAIFSHRCG